MTNSDPNREQLVTLHELLLKHFDIKEMQIMCFTLGIDYDELPGESKSIMTLTMITHLERRDQLDKLIEYVTTKRPKVSWPQLQAQSHVPFSNDSYTDEKTGLTMIQIPAGEYLYGEDTVLDARDENEMWQNLIEDGVIEAKWTSRMSLEFLPAYWISKTPVTNRHYWRFNRATDYAPPTYWESDSPPGAIADHPIYNVSRRDAVAYCEWADMKLPTEQEWEKAARGPNGFVFPWGNDWKTNHCNSSEYWREKQLQYHFIEPQTTPVGQFSPQGDSPYGCVDMSGNMWEWTESCWDEDHSDVFVIRGGMWEEPYFLVRATIRFPHKPLGSEHNPGFRVVRRLPS